MQADTRRSSDGYSTTRLPTCRPRNSTPDLNICLFTAAAAAAIMSSKLAAGVVAYPSIHPETGEELKFDMDYYLSGCSIPSPTRDESLCPIMG